MTPTVWWLYHVALWLVFWGAGAALAFVGLYSLTAPWWRSWIGRSMVALAGSLFILLGIVASSNMGWTHSLGVIPALSIQLAVFAVIALATTGLCLLLARAQLRGLHARIRRIKPRR